MSLSISMSFFEHGVKTKVMSTELIIEANVSKKILFKAITLAKNFEVKYSAYIENSLLSRINKASGIEAIPCDETEIEIFIRALKMAELSNGLFDPTIGALTQGIYGFGKESAKIPTEEELLLVKRLVNFREFKVLGNQVYLNKKGMKLDLGGIGKGYVADKIIQFLQKKGATKALVSVGGEICSFGKKYNIALRDPFSNNNLGLIKTTSNMLSISTSGDYERYIGSKKHHHILDNTTARQNHYYSSITIIKNGLETTLLDAVATIAFNSPPEKLKVIAQQYKVAIISVSAKKEIYIENFSNLDIQGFELFSFYDKM